MQQKPFVGIEGVTTLPEMKNLRPETYEIPAIPEGYKLVLGILVSESTLTGSLEENSNDFPVVKDIVNFNKIEKYAHPSEREVFIQYCHNESSGNSWERDISILNAFLPWVDGFQINDTRSWINLNCGLEFKKRLGKQIIVQVSDVFHNFIEEGAGTLEEQVQKWIKGEIDFADHPKDLMSSFDYFSFIFGHGTGKPIDSELCHNFVDKWCNTFPNTGIVISGGFDGESLLKFSWMKDYPVSINAYTKLRIGAVIDYNKAYDYIAAFKKIKEG